MKTAKNDNYFWEARATCKDGTELDLLFSYVDDVPEHEQQHNVEEFLLNVAVRLHHGVEWYSVDFVER